MNDTIIGLLACAVSSLFFGSMFVPVRRFKPGDGIIVQWVMCSAIFTVGLLVYLFRGLPSFQPFAMLGGLLWATGNLTAVPIIERIGLGLGILVWGSVNCVVGWSIGRFGLFGTHASVPHNPIMNYAGVVLVIVGGVLFSQVKASMPATEERTSVVAEQPTTEAHVSIVVAETDAEQHLLAEEHQQIVEAPAAAPEPTLNGAPAEEQAPGSAEQSTPKSSTAKIVGILLSLIAGACYGSTFVPVIHIQDNPEKFDNPPKEAIDYVFSHFAGIYLTSISVLIIYLAYKRNRPHIDHQIIGPALIAGLMWSIAQIAWFVANDCLSQAVTFPINAMVPGVCGTLWSVFYFKEITGRRNMQLLAVAIVITLTGAALVGLSK